MASEEALEGWSDAFLESFGKTDQYIALFTSAKDVWSMGRMEKEVKKTFQDVAISLVFDYVKAHLDVTDSPPELSVYVVWWVKVLQNWKCLLSTTLPDGMYYEVTYDGDKDKAYLDAYKKFDNVAVSFGEDSEEMDAAGDRLIARVHAEQRRINEGG